LSDVHGSVPVQQRGLGMVFQDYALFPHLNVARNVGFGLSGLSTELRQARVEHALALVSLPQMHTRYPHELSGGQQQRVALARAMAVRPHLLLLDEPFSSLDVSLRQQLAQSLRQLLKQQHMTALMVTHDQHEAFALGDQIGVMFDGALHQWADPRRVYEHPATAEVAQFIGQGAWLRVEPLRGQSGQGWETALGHWPATRAGVFGDRAWLRAHDVLVGGHSSRRAQVLSTQYRGADTVCQLQVATGEHIVALVDPSQRLACGEWVGVSIKL
jgi:iron(III) transport system ATP-binding protein